MKFKYFQACVEPVFLIVDVSLSYLWHCMWEIFQGKSIQTKVEFMATNVEDNLQVSVWEQYTKPSLPSALVSPTSGPWSQTTDILRYRLQLHGVSDEQPHWDIESTTRGEITVLWYLTTEIRSMTEKVLATLEEAIKFYQRICAINGATSGNNRTKSWENLNKIEKERKRDSTLVEIQSKWWWCELKELFYKTVIAT